jgi:hypothetical protein
MGREISEARIDLNIRLSLRKQIESNCSLEMLGLGGLE